MIVLRSREESSSFVRVRGGNFLGVEGICRYVIWFGSLRYVLNKFVMCYMIGLKNSLYCLKWFCLCYKIICKKWIDMIFKKLCSFII